MSIAMILVCTMVIIGIDGSKLETDNTSELSNNQSELPMSKEGTNAATPRFTAFDRMMRSSVAKNLTEKELIKYMGVSISDEVVYSNANCTEIHKDIVGSEYNITFTHTLGHVDL